MPALVSVWCMMCLAHFLNTGWGGEKKKKRRQAERPEIILLGSLHLSRTKPRLVTYICHLIMPFFFFLLHFRVKNSTSTPSTAPITQGKTLVCVHTGENF